MTDIENARAAKRAAADQYIERSYNKYLDDVRRWSLEANDQKFLDLIVTGRIADRALLCNKNVRKVMQYALIDAALDEFQNAPLRRWYWITLAWDLGVTMERDPCLDLVSLQNVAKHNLRRSGLDGVGTVEIDVWKNLTGEQGRRIVAQIHFLGWPRDPDNFKWKETQANLRKKRGLRNSLGAHSVVIKPVRPGPSNIAHLAMYMSKAPAAAKNLVPRPGRNRLWPAELSAGSAVRLIEVLSHIEAGDVLFSIGEGKNISRAVQREIRLAVRPRAGRRAAPAHDLLEHHWCTIRLVNGSKKIRTPVIVTRRQKRPMSAQ